MAQRSLEVRPEKLHLAYPFRISGYVFTETDAVLVEIREGGHVGRGEAAGVYYAGDGAEQMLAGIEAARERIEAGIGRAELQALLPAGGARNALDCALWELEARLAGCAVWQLARLAEPKPLMTTFTLGAEPPEVAAAGARAFAGARAIKLKLDGDFEADVARLAAVREARPDVWLGVDANQGYERDGLDALVAVLVEHRVSLLEQPLARGREADLDGYRSPIPIAADESALTLGDLRGLVGRFDVVNIKLDKCGGLTEGLRIAAEARKLGLGVMVGNMVGTSLAMAPAFVLGQLCDYVDLDGPTFLAEDRQPSAVYRDGFIDCGPEVWGGAERVAA
jgi:L-alanine-DL-glutamate epimerase-like enolase superfamily enzyme